MNSLIILRDHLQNILNDSTESDCYQEALSDCIYACQFETSTALDQHLDTWLTVCPIDSPYRYGVQFVSDTWQEIKRGNENE